MGWKIALFIAHHLTHRAGRQLRVGFEFGLRAVIGDDRQIPLATHLIETLRRGKEALQ